MKLKILISGSHGFIGRAVARELGKKHELYFLVRGAAGHAREIHWSPEEQAADPEQLEGFDILINLAGENIAAKRWSAAQKEKIRSSRVKTTSILTEAILGLRQPPKTFISASATGFYGDRGDELVDEQSPAGKDFLASVCQAWEEAAYKAAGRTRVVCTRFGVVLGRGGGMLGKLLPLFQAGLGGRISTGQQYLSWIALDDLISALSFLLENESITGPVCVTSPNPVRNAFFTEALAGALHRPALFTVPAFAVRMIFGEMGESLLLAGQRAVPRKLLENGFQFTCPDVTTAIEHAIA